MSERGLVVHHQALADIETALSEAAEGLTTYVADLKDAVDDQTAGWTEDTPSRLAQRGYESRLGTSVVELTDCLAEVGAAVASYRESAHDIEVENVAIVG